MFVFVKRTMPQTLFAARVRAKKALVEASSCLPAVKKDEKGTRLVSPGISLQVMQELYPGMGWC